MARRTKKAPDRPIIFDTDILIWYFRGNPKAKSLLENTDRDRRWISSLSLMELLQGCRRQEELLDAQAFVAENIPVIIHPKTSVSEKAIHLIEDYSLSHGLRVIDALIASSALLCRSSLATGNDRHFDFIPGIRLIPFFP